MMKKRGERREKSKIALGLYPQGRQTEPDGDVTRKRN
jgi:hypothetical protein